MFKEVKRFIVCQNCLTIIEKMSIRLRFNDFECSNCHKMVYVMYSYQNPYEAEKKKEEIQKRRDKRGLT